MTAPDDFKFEIGQPVLIKASGKGGTVTARRPGAVEPGYSVELEDGGTLEVKEGELRSTKVT